MTARPPEQDWRREAERLASQLQDAGFIRRGALHRAFAETPRHLFIPAILNHGYDEAGRQHLTTIGSHDPAWWTTVYSDEALITQYKPLSSRPDELMPTSSSTRPSLMADMIEELDIEPGMRVLESGSGTGYNAAILCHLAGAENVTTIDIDPELVTDAQSRLAGLGYHPSFTAEDGTYDRILATHAVDTIPPEWMRWAKPACQILTDLRSSNMPDIGAWAKLTVTNSGTEATGHLIPDRGAFMNARTTADQADGHAKHVLTHLEAVRTRAGDVEPDVLNIPAFAFTLWCQMPNTTWSTFEDDGRLHANIASSDGRWADVTADSVAYTIFGDPWAAVEEIWTEWSDAGMPGLDAYAITVTEDGRTIIEPGMGSAQAAR